MRLFARLEAQLGVALLLVTLFRASTVRALAGVLRGRDQPGAWTSLVPMRPEGGLPPLFCVHGVGGNVIGYRDLALHLDPERPVYGLQARGMDGKTPSLTTVEEMAAHYIEEIRTVRSEGPYLLCGLSFGGVVVFEMARQLAAQGREVAFVGLFDSVLRPAAWADGRGLRERLRLLWQRARLHLGAFRRTPRGQRYDFFRVRARRIERRLRSRLWRARHGQEEAGTPVLPPTLQNVREGCYLAACRYVPKPYTGHVVYFRAAAEAEQRIGPDPVEAWRVVAEGLSVCPVPGSHASMLEEPNVRVLADRLNRMLRETGADGYAPHETRRTAQNGADRSLSVAGGAAGRHGYA